MTPGKKPAFHRPSLLNEWARNKPSAPVSKTLIMTATHSPCSSESLPRLESRSQSSFTMFQKLVPKRATRGVLLTRTLSLEERRSRSKTNDSRDEFAVGILDCGA